MSVLKQYSFWFVVGSQHLYGEETLRQVAQHAEKMVKGLNASEALPCTVLCKPTVVTPDQITELMQQANNDPTCAGIITWMHTFSPSKMWISQ